MKSYQLHSFDAILKDTVAIHGQAEINKMKEYLTTLQLQPGQKCYELNMRTAEITEATYDKEYIQMVTRKNLITDQAYTVAVTKREIIRKNDFLYMPAINAANARRKFIKLFQSFNAKYPGQ